MPPTLRKRVFLSIRSHADDASERSIIINDNKTSYDIMMDLDNDGDLDTRPITLPDGMVIPLLTQRRSHLTGAAAPGSP